MGKSILSIALEYEREQRLGTYLNKVKTPEGLQYSYYDNWAKEDGKFIFPSSLSIYTPMECVYRDKDCCILNKSEPCESIICPFKIKNYKNGDIKNLSNNSIIRLRDTKICVYTSSVNNGINLEQKNKHLYIKRFELNLSTKILGLYLNLGDFKVDKNTIFERLNFECNHKVYTLLNGKVTKIQNIEVKKHIVEPNCIINLKFYKLWNMSDGIS